MNEIQNLKSFLVRILSQKMDLSKLTRLSHCGFVIHQLGFSYMPELPIKWNPNLKRLEYTSKIAHLVLFSVSMLLNLLVSIGSAYNIITHLFLKPKPDYDTSILVLHTCAFLVCGAVPVGFVLLTRHPNFLSGYNQQINFQQNLPPNGILSDVHEPPDNKIMFLSLYSGICLIFIGIFTPFAILFSSLYFRFDPFYFVFQDIFGEAEKQTELTKCVCFIIRFIIVLAGFEASRTGILAIYCFVNVIIHICRFINSISYLDLTTNTKRAFEIFRLYKKFLVCFREIQELFEQLNSLLTSLSYWGVVLLTGAVVKLRNFMVPEMFALILGLDLVIFLLLSFGVAINSMLDASITEAIARWGKESERNYSKRRLCSLEERKDLLVLRKVLRSLQPLRIQYKPFFTINQEFRIDMSKKLVEQVFDGILLLEV